MKTRTTPNLAPERTAGSDSLAAAAHRGVMRTENVFKMRVLLARVVLILAATGSAPVADPPTSIGVSEVSGIWKRCYVPGLAGVSEPDAGYLVLMPDYRYYEIGEDCCREGHEPPIVEWVGRYSVDGVTVVLRRVDNNGRESEQRLRYIEGAEVVLFDDLKGTPVSLPVLQAGETLNYGYAKVFWRRGWWK